MFEIIFKIRFLREHITTIQSGRSLGTWGKEAIDFLRRSGVVFSETLHREGGHSEHRIWHVHDHTGQSLMKALSETVRKNERITVEENIFVSDFSRAWWGGGGRSHFRGKAHRFFASRTILATGGTGQIYAETTNLPSAQEMASLSQCVLVQN